MMTRRMPRKVDDEKEGKLADAKKDEKTVDDETDDEEDEKKVGG